MSRHSLPSSRLPSSRLPDRGQPDRVMPRHALADSVEDESAAADTPLIGRPAAIPPVAIPPVAIPPVAIPQPRSPQESRHAAELLGPDHLGPATAASRHAAQGPTGGRNGGHRVATPGRHAAAAETAVVGRAAGEAVEPVTVPVPAGPAAPAPQPVDATDRTATNLTAVDQAATDEAPTRTARRHAAAPQRRRRRASVRTGDTARPATGRRTLGGSRRTAAVLLTAAVALVALPTAGSAAVDQCRWQVAAHELLVSLDDQTDARSTQLRKALIRAGVGTELPAECAGQAAGQAASPAPATTSPRTRAPRTTAPKPAPATTPPKASAAPTTTTAAPAPAAAAAGTGTGTTAAQALGWGTPTKSDDFSAGLGQWGIYDGSGHAGNGRRTPSAVTTAGGIMTMTGDANGNTGGMAWGDGQKYGRWEARVRSSAGSYHPVMLLWPDAENWPVGGEVDWMEISDPARKVADTFLHYGANNNQVQGNVNVDATQWHNWAVEWTPQGITTFLDGKAWWSTKNTSILPPGPMHMTIQLDNFGGRNTATQMQVDWVKQYKA